MHYTHVLGTRCETILRLFLVEKGFYVFAPLMAQGPVDVVAISPDGEVYLFDSKADRFRDAADRPVPHRIHRKRSALQKKLNVRMAYINPETRSIWLVPPMGDEQKGNINDQPSWNAVGLRDLDSPGDTGVLQTKAGKPAGTGLD